MNESVYIAQYLRRNILKALGYKFLPSAMSILVMDMCAI
jgi:hypothetical protein